MPHLAGIMDTATFPSVERIGNCKAPQTGSSAALETLLAYFSDMKPGPALIVYPDRETARKRSTDYLQDIWNLSPSLRPLLTGLDDDMAGLRIKLKTMLIYLGWAGSATSIANVSAKYLFLDEVDKFPERPSKKEAGSVDLVLERVRAFKYGRKVFYNSTPTVESAPMWKFLSEEAQVVFDFCVPCPKCGHVQRMEFDQIKWPEDVRNPKEIELGLLATYECKGCGDHLDDRTRDLALENGHWFERLKPAEGEKSFRIGRPRRQYLEEERPSRVCFHSPGWISHLVSLSECAAWFLRGLKDPEALKYFRTQICAECWKTKGKTTKVDRVLAYRDDRPAGLVPAGNLVSCLLAGVDTHDDGFYFDIYALGYGLDLDAWQIRSGFAPTFDALGRVLFEDEYKDANGINYHVHLALQDAMGHRTAEVYDFARMYPGRLIPIMGHQRKQTPFSWGKIDVYPGTNKPIPGGIQLLHIDTTYFKNQLASKFKIEPSDPGSLRLHSEATEEYAGQLCAEALNEKGVWELLDGRDNHHGDDLVYLFTGAEVLGVKFWARPEPVVVVPDPVVMPSPGGGNPFTGGRQVFGRG